MKKGTSVFLFLITFLGTTLFSCKLKIEDSTLYPKPDVNVAPPYITVTIPSISSNTNYLNIYRRDKDNDEIIPIGLLFNPTAIEDDHKNFFFKDTMVKKDHSYDYRVRYLVDGEYFYTKWSEVKEASATEFTYTDSDNFKYQTEGAYLLFESLDNTLTIKGTITEPSYSGFTSDYKPMLILKSSSETQTFKLTNITDGLRITLSSETLPPNFLDTDFTIEGIVGQKVDYVDNNDPKPDEKKIVYWTEPATIDVRGAGSTKIINIPSQNGGSEGIDISLSIR